MMVGRPLARRVRGWKWWLVAAGGGVAVAAVSAYVAVRAWRLWSAWEAVRKREEEDRRRERVRARGSADGDRQALLALYRQTGGEDWTRNDGWGEEGVPLGEWHGVTTDTETGTRVVELFLQDNNLQGAIPEEIGRLTELREIMLLFNDIESLPESVCNWVSLRSVDLSNNLLTALPEGISGWGPTLQEFFCNECKLRTLPEGAAQWRALKILSLANNRLYDLPDDARWEALQQLYLSENRLEALPEPAAEHWTSLRELAVDGNNLEELPERAICYWTQLEQLELHGNRHLGALPDGVSAWRALRMLNMWDCALDSLPEAVSGWQSLQSLNMARCGLETLPDACSHWAASVEQLYVNENALQGSGGVSSLRSCARLRKLQLEHNNLSRWPSDTGSAWKELRSLSLSGNQLRTFPVEHFVRDGNAKGAMERDANSAASPSSNSGPVLPHRTRKLRISLGDNDITPAEQNALQSRLPEGSNVCVSF